MYIFLDESGDLGFDPTKRKTSKFFVMTLLVSNDLHSIREINLSIGKTLKKVNGKKRTKPVNELKGANTPLYIKKYFLNRIANKDWNLYATVINKKCFKMPKYISRPKYLYNYIASNLIGKISIINPKSTVIISVDRCKTKKEIHEFNRNIEETFYPKLHKSNSLIIQHHASHNMKLLQAVDLFCSGLFDKYEHNDLSWYNCFCNRIYIEDEIKKDRAYHASPETS